MLTQDLLHELFILDSENGVLIARADGINRKKGQVVGGPSATKGRTYWQVSVNSKLYRRSRLIFCMVHGYFPEIVDHINLDSLNDRPENLRAATPSQSSVNTKPRIRKHFLPRGVWLCRGRFQTRMTVNYKPIHLGTFDTPEEASAIYQAALKKTWGGFVPRCNGTLT
jgi:hypothetical protein